MIRSFGESEDGGSSKSKESGIDKLLSALGSKKILSAKIDSEDDLEELVEKLKGINKSGLGSLDKEEVSEMALSGFLESIDPDELEAHKAKTVIGTDDVLFISSYMGFQGISGVGCAVGGIDSSSYKPWGAVKAVKDFCYSKGEDEIKHRFNPTLEILPLSAPHADHELYCYYMPMGIDLTVCEDLFDTMKLYSRGSLEAKELTLLRHTKDGEEVHYVMDGDHRAEVSALLDALDIEGVVDTFKEKGKLLSPMQFDLRAIIDEGKS